MVTIQKASPDHIETLIDFQQKLAFESEQVILNAAILRKGMQALFDDPAKGAYYIVLDGSKAIGCHMITFEWSDWRNGMVWWLQSVYVAESHRKKGIFRMMFDNISDMVKKDPGLMGMRLYVDKSNSRAMKAYEAMGMDGSHYTVYEWMKG